MRRAILVILALLPLLQACDMDGVFGNVKGSNFAYDEPTVTLRQALLTEYPALDQLGAYYCPALLSGGELACNALLGPQPLKTDLEFRFRVDLDVKNPNTFPIPAVEMLTSLTLFPELGSETLAAVCVGFCEADALDCSTAPLQGQCSSDEPEILSIDDFVDAAINLIQAVVTEEVTGGVPPELMVRTIGAGETGQVYLELAVGLDPMLELLENVFSESWSDYIDTNEFVLTIPYRLEGTLWFVVEGFGKIPIGFGPLDGEWKI